MKASQADKPANIRMIKRRKKGPVSGYALDNNLIIRPSSKGMENAFPVDNDQPYRIPACHAVGFAKAG
jgi:hypothetical protein